MRILLHMCCGPCSITVIRSLLEADREVTGFFFNPNIHPLAEYMRRRQGALEVTELLGVPLILADVLPDGEQRWFDPWGGEPATEVLLGRASEHASPPKIPHVADPRPWLRAVAGKEHRRCDFCWRLRLRKTAEMASHRGFSGFSSSLLYSRYQDHMRIAQIGRELEEEVAVSFCYQDFRTGWQDGIRVSKEWGIYRQQYCGCVYSEYERYSRDFARVRDSESKNGK